MGIKDFLLNLRMAVKSLYTQSDLNGQAQDLQVSAKMAAAITEWFRLFYLSERKPKSDEHRTRFASVLTNYMATLATNEIVINAGNSPRADFINDQISRFLLPGIRRDVQLAGVGGEVILKPFVSGKNIYPEVITADRYYPTRINGAGTVEAGFFTDYDQKNGRTVVRIERFDLRPEGLYLNNKAYYEGTSGLGMEIPLTEIYRWREIQPDVLLTGLDRVHFATLKMPFANTVDNTSPLPVSIFANAVEALYELDKIYSAFLWEVYTGKRKQIIDRRALTPFKGKHPLPLSELSSDLYLVLSYGDEAGDKKVPFDDYTPEMRIDAYQKAIDIQLRLLEMQCGFSAGTFTFDVRAGKMTATQIISEDKDTYNTVKSIQDCGLAQGLKDLVYLYDWYASLYSLAPSGKIEPSVTFGDSIFEDTAVEFSRRKQMADGGYLKKEKLVGWYFGVSDEEALNDYMPDVQSPDDILFGGGR